MSRIAFLGSGARSVAADFARRLAFLERLRHELLGSDDAPA
jgi:hypothetical protein